MSLIYVTCNTSVIRQKDESQNGCFKKAKHGNFGVLCFLETPVLRFALLPYYRRITASKTCCTNGVFTYLMRSRLFSFNSKNVSMSFSLFLHAFCAFATKHFFPYGDPLFFPSFVPSFNKYFESTFRNLCSTQI